MFKKISLSILYFCIFLCPLSAFVSVCRSLSLILHSLSNQVIIEHIPLYNAKTHNWLFNPKLTVADSMLPAANELVDNLIAGFSVLILRVPISKIKSLLSLQNAQEKTLQV